MRHRQRTRRNGLGLPLSKRHDDVFSGSAASVSDAVRGFIETKAKAADLQERENKRLARSPVGCQIARSIRRCRIGRRCRNPQCKRCARLFRLWVSPQAISFYQTFARCKVVTLNLKDIPVSELVQVDLAKEKDALSKRLRRFGIIACIGNMEIAYKPRRNKWCLHVHLLVFGHSKKELKSFCQTFPMKRAGLVQEISDPLVQITYLFKYGTSYHFPGSKRPWPLPDQRLVELARWRSRYKFNDHLLLIGFRRHGTIMLNSDIAKKLSRRRLGDVET